MCCTRTARATAGSQRTERGTEKVTAQQTLGTYKYLNGDRYEGEWKNDKKDGKGTLHNQHNRNDVLRERRQVRGRLERGQKGGRRYELSPNRRNAVLRQWRHIRRRVER